MKLIFTASLITFLSEAVFFFFVFLPHICNSKNKIY